MIDRTTPDRHGLIQHSFAMRVSGDLRPLYAREGVADAHRLLERIFATREFTLDQGGTGDEEDQREGPWDHSVLMRHRKTTIKPHPFHFKQEGIGLPESLAWSESKCSRSTGATDSWKGFVIGGVDQSRESPQKDFLVQAGEGEALSQLLCQLLAHRRSRLFGLPLARETINVLLPHAVLSPDEGNDGARADWFVQPALSLFYVYGRRGFRPIFSFSLFLIPCDASKPAFPSRTMSGKEMRDSVHDQWPLATAFNTEERPRFTISGPLGAYLSDVAGPAMNSLGIQPTTEAWTMAGDQSPGLTLRTFTEATLFALTLRMIRGTSGKPSRRVIEEIGDRVLTALSASRVSSVVVVDDTCSQAQPGFKRLKTCSRSNLSALLSEVSKTLSSPNRVPGWISRAGEEGYRLDRDFFDTGDYATAVLPASRCVVMVGDRCAQRGLKSSLLLEAGWTAYMVIGAATATGMIRSVFRDISRADRSKPDLIADIEREAMVELHETYDLEITTETYRRRYRLLRERLGITAEFQALSDKLEALYRETSTRFEGRSERRLQLLTWATAILSAVIAAGTLVLIFKGG